MLTLKDIGQIIKEETHAVLEADTRVYYPGERARLRGRDAEKEFFGAYGSEPVEEQPEVEAPKRGAKSAANEKRWADFAEKVRQRTAGPGPQKPVAPEDVEAFELYKKLHYDLLDFTEEQRLWMAGDVAGRGVLPRKVLRQEVPEILDAIEKVENNEIDPELQKRLTRFQVATPGETEAQRAERTREYRNASNDYIGWTMKPHAALNKWLKTSRGMDFAIEYNIFDLEGAEEEEFPGGEEAVRRFQQVFDDKIEMEKHLLDNGYSVDQLSYYLQDPEGIYGEK